MEKIFDVTALGELLIDFIEHGLENLGSDNLSEMLKFASAAASTCKKHTYILLCTCGMRIWE